MGKSIRFSELVKSSGRPEVAIVWTDPTADPKFAEAIRQNRILSVKQEPVGNKKDYGLIGFQEEKNVSYLIFPKPLPERPTDRVIGINYDLIEQPKVSDPVSTTERPATRRRSQPKERKEKQFTAVIRRTAVWETTINLSAQNKAEARSKAEAFAKKHEFPAAEAVVKDEVRDIYSRRES